ncbi:MAG: hypothetical protein QW594_03790 [Candidatus Woesearchaeota archaeon]
MKERMEYKKYPNRKLRHMLSFPFIWMMIIPLIILDVFLEVYHHICFPLYGLKKIKRKEYIKIDRHRLEYLPWYDKINCMYCGYANGLLHYASKIAAATEAYWCAIRHQQTPSFHSPPHHRNFLAYGDEQGFRKKYGVQLNTKKKQ